MYQTAAAGFAPLALVKKAIPEDMYGLPPKVHAGEFYQEYRGHYTAHLEAVLARLRGAGKTRFVYLAGDSSLDNKHWFFSHFVPKLNQLGGPSDFVAPALNGFQTALDPPYMVKDVNYWMNVECELRKADETACLNCAVEESCIGERERIGLPKQDKFIRDHITEDDVLVVNVGGNDVALKPSCGVIVNMALLLFFTPQLFIMISPLLAPCLFYFIYMFRVRLREYIEALISVRRPRKVVVCMVYFLDEKPGGSWADNVLERLGYNSNPAKLQAVIRKIYEWGVSQIKIPGVEVVPLPLYEVLDGKDTNDYVQRVEPSVVGGQKMAEAIAVKVFGY